LLGWYIDRLQDGWLGFDSWEGKVIFLNSAALRLVLRPTHPRKWVVGALSRGGGVKWLGHEADHSSQSSGRVKNDGAIPALPDTLLWHGA
jgi:hypothetical protein